MLVIFHSRDGQGCGGSVDLRLEEGRAVCRRCNAVMTLPEARKKTEVVRVDMSYFPEMAEHPLRNWEEQ